MTDQFHLQSGSLPRLSRIHDDVVAALGQLTGTAPESRGVETSHGQIASGVSSALGAALPSRLSTLHVTSASAQAISDILMTADQLYERGDQEGAEKLRAAAAALENSEDGSAGVGSGGIGTGAGGAAGAGGGADQAGQIAGQLGQIAGTLAQSVQGLAQGLTQLPQQIIQGVQGMAQSGAGAETKTDGRASSEGQEKQDDDQKDREGKERAARDAAEAQRDAAPSQRDGALPGASAEQGKAPAPTPTPPVEPKQPAQTRPQ